MFRKNAVAWSVAAAVIAAAVSATACEILMALSVVLLIVTRTPWRVPPIWLPLTLFMAGTLVSLVASGHVREGVPQVKKFFVYLILALVFTAFHSVRHLLWWRADGPPRSHSLPVSACGSSQKSTEPRPLCILLSTNTTSPAASRDSVPTG
jgi:hypothetical protein